MPTANAGNKSASRAQGNKFVSRAEGKLAGAVRAFAFDFRGKVVLDIGSSTGGFTEFALAAGAKKVVAVEKGTRQMKAPLRFDPRVELHEKTDIKGFFLSAGLENQKNNCGIKGSSSVTGLEKAENNDGIKGFFLSAGLENQKNNLRGPSEITVSVSPHYFSDFQICLCTQKEPFDVILADVSFTSLRPILLHAKENLAGERTEFLVMLKPQFEARDEQLVKGVVKNEKIRREIIKDFEKWLARNGFVILGKRDNEVVGKNGNQERFYYLKKSV